MTPAAEHPSGITEPASSTEVVAVARRRKFTTAYMQRIVREADACTAPGAIGALLRREGLYSSHLSKWRLLIAASDATRRPRGRDREGIGARCICYTSWLPSPPDAQRPHRAAADRGKG